MWKRLAIPGLCVCLLLSAHETKAQADPMHDQVMAARAAALYVLQQGTEPVAPGERPFLVPMVATQAHDAVGRREVHWDSAQKAELQEMLKTDVLEGPRPFGPDGRATRAFSELVVTAPLLMGDSAEAGVSLCRVSARGRACGGEIYRVTLRREGAAWKVVAAKVTGAL